MRFDSRHAGGLAVFGAFALFALGDLFGAALGTELLGSAFWWWARSGPRAAEQVSRWSWVRRPAAALWLAFAIDVAVGGAHHLGRTGAIATALGAIEAGAVVYAGLELLAALPLARVYSDLPGPLLAIRPWLPVLLPSAGFLILWRQAPHWIEMPVARNVSASLLLLTTLLATLRAFTRRRWTASLRWMVVADCALGALLVGRRLVDPMISLALWAAAFGCHAYLIAGEIRGATPRRGAFVSGLWRFTSWVAITALMWPALVAYGEDVHGILGVLLQALGAVVALLTSWISIARLEDAPERRRVMRPRPTVTFSHLVAPTAAAISVVALVRAWWSGFEPPWPASVLLLAASGLGGGFGVFVQTRDDGKAGGALERSGRLLRAGASIVFTSFVRFERRVLGLFQNTAHALTRSLHDLHTGDAQEYLLFLIGVAIVSLVLPLLQ